MNSEKIVLDGTAQTIIRYTELARQAEGCKPDEPFSATLPAAYRLDEMLYLCHKVKPHRISLTFKVGLKSR